MNTKGVIVLLGLLIVISVVQASRSADAKRVALVVGNGAYAHTTSLANPRNDALDIATSLRALGFEVFEGLDLDGAGFADKVRDFARAARGAEAALFYYAGHGLQVEGRNYLVPVDARLGDEADLTFEALELADVVALMERASPVNLVFLDACRDNPLAQGLARSMGSSRSTAVGRGLARIDSGVGTLIAYATEPGNVAADGTGRNSPFTAAMLQHLSTPGLEVNQLLNRVRQSVVTATDRQQIPWTHSSLTGDFYLSGSGEAAPVTSASAPSGLSAGSASQMDDRQLDLAFWESIEDSEDWRDYQAYLDRYGQDGSFSPLAVVRRDRLRAKEVQSAAAAPAPTNGAGVLVPGSRFRDCDKCPEMVVVPAGSFRMGDLSGTGHENEKPVREVRIRQSFAAGVFEVTFAEWDACVRDEGCSDLLDDRGWGRGSRPAIDVNWYDARDYVHWLRGKTGEHYRLLSESEWEYVARAGSNSVYSFGSEQLRLCDHANGAAMEHEASWRNRSCHDAYEGTAPVGSFAMNAFGLYDVHGNVSEWVEDCYHESYRGAPSDGSSWAPSDGHCSYRVLRGGSWIGGPTDLRSANRDWDTSIRRLGSIGFRVARAL